MARDIMGKGPLLAPEQMVVIDTNLDRARRVARANMARYLRLPNYTNNLLGSVNLINASVNVGTVRCFVFTSSMAVYADCDSPLQIEDGVYLRRVRCAGVRVLRVVRATTGRPPCRNHSTT